MKKTTVILTSVALALVLLVTSCSKEQTALNNLAGAWKYTKLSVLGISIDLASQGYTNATIDFQKCDSKKTQICTGVINLTGTNPTPFTYDMASDGKSVKVIEQGGTTSTYKIVKLDKNNLVYTAPGLDTVINGQAIKLEVEFTCGR